MENLKKPAVMGKKIESKMHIENLVGRMSKKSGAKVKLPWQ